jgi:hypothetical protein
VVADFLDDVGRATGAIVHEVVDEEGGNRHDQREYANDEKLYPHGTG